MEAARESIARDLGGIVLPANGVDTKLRAERRATAERVHAARTREWELATANWEKRHPGISAANPAAGTAALEHDHQRAVDTVSRLERDRATAAERAHTATWERDYAAVDQEHAAAAQASVLRRRTAQEAYQSARQNFIATHGHEPTPQPPEQLRDTWRRDAIAPGRDERLDTARKRISDTRAKIERLHRDPAPTKPTAPTIGTPAQEAAKDVRYRHSRERIDARPTPKVTEPSAPKIPTRGLER